MSSEHGHNNHPPHLAHHFETPKQQFESGKLGMWVFLATEILMFGGLFCAYSIYRGNHQDVFLYGYGALNKYWGATNTVVLLASSLTMAWGVRAAQKGQQKLLLAMLIATFMGGVGFMCIKTIEYKAKWDHHLFPGTMNAFYYKNGAAAYPDKIEDAIVYIDAHNTGGHAPAHGEHAADAHAEVPAHDEHTAPEAASEASEAHAEAAESHSAVIIPAAFGAPADVSLIPHPAASTETGLLDSAIDNAGVTVLPHAGHTQRTWASLSPEEQGKVHIFFSIYFLMTGLHGLHVLIGMAVILWLIIKAAKGTFGKEYFTPVDIGGLYWHLVDLIWIFLFPLLYLIH